MSIAKYDQYKPSGVDWLGSVPHHWVVMPIRLAAKLESGHTPSRSKPGYWENCDIPWFTLGDVWQIRDGITDRVFATKEKVSKLGLANSAARLLPRGTVILSRTASVGFAAIMGVDMATTQDFANWVCSRKLKPEFLLYVFRAMSGEFERLRMGSTHNTIYMPDISAMRFALPPLEDQEAIVRFLARETAKIDELVAEQRRLIELLKQKRQAVISHAVTKGLNPHAPTKPSGIDWLGKIPAGWTLSRVKFIVQHDAGLQMGPFGGMLLDLEPIDTGFKVFGQENTISGDFTLGRRWVSQDRYRELEKYALAEGDLVLTRKGSLGNARVVSVLPQPGIIDSDTIRIRVDARVALARFLALLLHEAEYVSRQIDLAKRGAILPGVNTSTIANLYVVLPPLAEQERILNHLEFESQRFDALERETSRAVEILHERRTALISAAVTGKIDVRGLAATEAA